MKKWIVNTAELSVCKRGDRIFVDSLGRWRVDDNEYQLPLPDGIFEAMPHWFMEESDCRALIVVESEIQYKPPSYGRRTLVEKIGNVYKASNGEITPDKGAALKAQGFLDMESRIWFWVDSYFSAEEGMFGKRTCLDMLLLRREKLLNLLREPEL